MVSYVKSTTLFTDSQAKDLKNDFFESFDGFLIIKYRFFKWIDHSVRQTINWIYAFNASILKLIIYLCKLIEFSFILVAKSRIGS